MAKAKKAAARKQGRAAKKPAAKKEAAAKAAPRPSDGAPQGKAMAIPSDNQIRDSVKSLAQMRKAARSVAGEVGQKVAELVDKKHFHAKALADVLKARDMPDDKFAIYYTHRGIYENALGFEQRAKLQGEMFSDGDETEDEGDDHGTPPGEKDVRPRHLRAVEGEQDTFVGVGDAAKKTGTDG